MLGHDQAAPKSGSPLGRLEEARREAENDPAVHAGSVSAMASRDNQLAEDQVQLAAGRDLANWATAVRRLQVS
ncbi:MAG: hypothetical protein ACJ8BC_13580, partial [Gemmatimonadales bacterium]